MEIENRTLLTAKAAATVFCSSRRAKIRRYLIGLYGLIIPAILWDGFMDWPLLLFALLFIGYFFYYPVRIRKYFQKVWGGDDQLNISYLIKDDEVVSSTSGSSLGDSQSSYPYTSFSRLTYTENYIVLYIAKVHMLIIDKAGFASTADCDAVMAHLEKKIAKK